MATPKYQSQNFSVIRWRWQWKDTYILCKRVVHPLGLGVYARKTLLLNNLASRLRLVGTSVYSSLCGDTLTMLSGRNVSGVGERTPCLHWKLRDALKVQYSSGTNLFLKKTNEHIFDSFSGHPDSEHTVPPGLLLRDAFTFPGWDDGRIRQC
jgi:hypothetical protein